MNTGFIDWQKDSLTLYIFDKRGSHYELSDTNTIPLENSLTAEALTSLVTTGVNTVYLSIPADELTLREQDFPFADDEKINEFYKNGFTDTSGLFLSYENSIMADEYLTINQFLKCLKR